jgi:type IV pilus assembly protein PilX
MAGNLRDRTLAFEAAEAALREAEDVLDGAGFGSVPTASAPTPSIADMLDRGEQIEAASPTGVELLRAGVAQLPRVLIEETAVVLPGGGVESDVLATRAGADTYYAVTALGYGSAPQARVMLQSVLARRF